MTPNPIKKKILKFSVVFVLAWFLIFMVFSAIFSYLPQWDAKADALKLDCENNWFVRDVEQNICMDDTEEVLNTEETCIVDWWTWYAENSVCIK